MREGRKLLAVATLVLTALGGIGCQGGDGTSGEQAPAEEGGGGGGLY